MVSNLLSGVPPLFAELARILSGDIDCSLRALTSYSTDGSPYIVRPQAIIYPKNATDIKHIVSFSREYGMPITVRGGGSACSGGGLGEGIIVDITRYFTNIRQINLMDQTITVDVGVNIKTLREKLIGWHVDVPVLPNDDKATVGGCVATKSSTPSTFHHGSIREWIESVTVVVDTGEEHKISDGITPSGRLLGIYQTLFPVLSENGPTLRAGKPETNDDATGYSLWNTTIGPRQLLDELVGSEGTLGIITSVTFRLAPYKTHLVTTSIPISNSSLLTTCIDIAKHHNAENIFMYDSTFRNLVQKYHEGLIPLISDEPFTLLITHKGVDKEKLHTTVRTFVRSLPVQEENITHTDNPGHIEKITSCSFLTSLLNVYTGGSNICITTADGIIVPLHFYGELLHTIDTYLVESGRLYTITGNAGSGHICIVTSFDPSVASFEKDLLEYNETIFQYVKKYKGGISAISGDGLSRTPYISYIYNDVMRDVFKKIKEVWDPKTIFNPGKKTDVTTHYLHEHLRTSVD